jgi:hypothetical protein
MVRGHMVATAMLMRVLSSRNESAAPSAYITGLLHDVGKLLLLQTEDASYEELLSKNPRRAVEKAVWGMLPKNRIARQQLKKLKVYAGSEHPHQAQQPEPFEITQVAQ